ncbi:unnamed protein product [Didymodactylos carnosus]|uniref:Peptidase M20 dimerisation domain-containing protein n=1 Tax=Didymodactylos carnosus TaxID=1234261 RepID=A0A814PYS7_9BILA|nr:unnamed protein product [Didymodactylos carnosus]CAF3876647.1 unnamed protein product [Didymodactylos carnosus]
MDESGTLRNGVDLLQNQLNDIHVEMFEFIFKQISYELVKQGISTLYSNYELLVKMLAHVQNDHQTTYLSALGLSYDQYLKLKEVLQNITLKYKFKNLEYLLCKVIEKQQQQRNKVYGKEILKYVTATPTYGSRSFRDFITKKHLTNVITPGDYQSMELIFIDLIEFYCKKIPSPDETELVSFLQKLLAIPSVTGTVEESLAQQWLAGQFEQNGFEIDLWQIDLPAAKSHPDFPGLEAPRTEALGLVAWWGGENGPTLVLNGHIDVVPPGDLNQWKGDPFSGRIENGRVYGRGSCDMKGGLVCNLFAIKAIKDAGIKLKGKVLFQSVVGEEDGGLGTFATLQRGYRGDAAIIPEPTEMQIISACAGALTFRLKLTGLAAHASNRLDGVSVIEKFWEIWKALKRLEEEKNKISNSLMARYKLPYPLSVGILQAGNWSSSVPDQLLAEGRLGVALGESPQTARKEFEMALNEVCFQDDWLRQHPVEIDWFGGQFASGQIPETHPLVILVSESHQSLFGNYPAVHGAPYGSDLRLMNGLGGIPTLHYGPGSVTLAHAPNEYVPISDLMTITRTLIKIIIDFCGVEEEV